MKVCGIIAEYDPFHSGHEYHLLQAKKESGADFVVVVMSCSFTQRGAAALLDPYARAKMALLSGADAVLGLPYAFSVRDAEHFALGGVEILEQLGATHLSFGCEDPDLNFLQQVAEIEEEQSETYKALLKEGLSAGLPYAAAQSSAVSAITGRADDALKKPNNNLAVCYIRALHRLNSAIIPVPIARDYDYHAMDIQALPSATAVRAAACRGDWEAVKRSLGQKAYAVFCDAWTHSGHSDQKQIEKMLLYRLRMMTKTDLSLLPEVSEGLENRIFDAAKNAASREELIQGIKTKRYSHSRISRILCHALTGMTMHLADEKPSYCRLLGFDKSAQGLVKQFMRSGLPVVDRPAGCKIPAFFMDMRADEIWQLSAGSMPSNAWRQNVVITERKK